MTHLPDFKTPGDDSSTPDTPITDWSDSKHSCSRCLIQVAGVSLLGKEQVFILIPPSLSYYILEHLNGNRHLEVVNETVMCSFCEKFIFTEFFDQHKLEFHEDALFKCAFGESCSAMV